MVASVISRSLPAIAGPAQILGNAKNLVAISTALVALANLPTAAASRSSGSGDKFVQCMDACDKIEFELLKLVC